MNDQGTFYTNALMPNQSFSQTSEIRKGRLKTLKIPTGSNLGLQKEDIQMRKDLSALKKVRKKSEERKKPLIIAYLGRIKEKVKRVRLRLGHVNVRLMKKKQFLILDDKSFVFPEETGGGDPMEEDQHPRGRASLSQLWRKVDKKIKLLQIILIPVKKLYRTLVLRTSTLTRRLNELPAIRMNNKAKLYFDFSVVIVSILNMIVFTISFYFDEPTQNLLKMRNHLSGQDHSDSSFMIFLVISLSILLLDIIVTMNTTYIEAGTFVTDRSQILANYVKTSLSVDFIVIMPIICTLYHDYLGFSEDFLSWMQLIFLLKLIKLKQIINNFEQVYQRKEAYEIFISLLSLGSNIFFVAHFLACFWHYTSYKSCYSETWLTKMGLQSASIYLKYLYSLYWAMTTMITVGYGDITPQNEKEVLMCMASMLLGCAVFGYALNKIGVIFDRVNSEKREFRKYINGINQYMINKNIESDLQVRVRNYLEFNWKEDKLCNKEAENDVYNKLSDTLRKEVLMQSYGKVLKSIPLFIKNFSLPMIEDLVSVMKQSRFYPGEMIFDMKEQSDFPLYVIEKGEIGLFANSHKITTLQKGSFFGEYSFVSGMPPNLSSKALTFGTIYRIERNDFLKILKDHQKDYELFCFMRDEVLLYNNIEKLYLRCYSCDQSNHMIDNCPNVKYIPSKSIAIGKAQYCPKQVRQNFKRRSCNKSQSPLWKLKYIYERTLTFLNNLYEGDAEDESYLSPSEYESCERFPVTESQYKATAMNPVSMNPVNMHPANMNISTHEDQGDLPEQKQPLADGEENEEEKIASANQKTNENGARLIKKLSSSDVFNAETNIKVPSCSPMLVNHQEYKQNLQKSQSNSLKPPSGSSQGGSPHRNLFEISFNNTDFLKSPEQSPVNPSPRINISLSGSLLEKEDCLSLEKIPSLPKTVGIDQAHPSKKLVTEAKLSQAPSMLELKLVHNNQINEKRSPRGKFGQKLLAFDNSPAQSPYGRIPLGKEPYRRREEEEEENFRQPDYSRSPLRKRRPSELQEIEPKTRRNERKSIVTNTFLLRKDADAHSPGGTNNSFKLELMGKNVPLEEELFEKGFDSGKIFTFYFPSNNIDSILKSPPRRKTNLGSSFKPKEKRSK